MDTSEQDRVWTIPNLLSIGRLGLFIWFLVELFANNDRLLAAIALSIAGVTDYLDGFIARRFHQMSDLGKILDPTVDRMMTTGTLISMMIVGALPIWIGSIVLAREVVVSLAALFVAARGVREIEVLFIGKLGTFGFMCSLPILLFSHGPGVVEHNFGIVGWVVLVPSALLSLAAAWIYLPRVQTALQSRGAQIS